MDKTLVIAKREMRSLVSEKTLILAMIIQLLIASFSSMLVIGLASFFDPSALSGYNAPRANVGIVGDGELKQFIEDSRVRHRNYSNLSSALDAFYKNRLDAVIVIPGAASGGDEIIRIVLYLPKSDIRGTLATLQLKKPLEDFESFVRDIRGKRINFEPIRLYVPDNPMKTSTYFEFIYGILIPLLVFTPVFISGGLIIDMLTEEYERKTMDLLLVSPLSFSDIMNGKILIAVIIVPIQTFLWLLLLIMNRISVSNIPIILLLSGIIGMFIVLMGAVVASRYKVRAVSQYIYSLVLILIFLIGYLLPLSPFNLVTRLSSGTAGIEALFNCVVYALPVLPLYVFLKHPR